MAEKEVQMSLWHLRSKKKPSGGKLNKNIKKKKRNRGSEYLETRIGKTKSKIVKTTGGRNKIKLLSIEEANVSDNSGKVNKYKILSVEDNKANPHFVRRNVVTKGAIIKTEAGLARVTSRPSQDGIVNAVLIEQ